MRPLLAIVGATATGKSALALRLAAELGGEIVNADALQAYRGFDIGTAKPTPEQRRRVPHHLIDILDPAERYSAGRFARDARRAIAEIGSRGRLALVVGGSGLYLRALLEGLSPLPEADPRVRAELQERLRREGLAALHAELTRTDPATASRLSVGDRQRVLRALEVARSSGRPLSAWIAETPAEGSRLSAVRVGLTLPRPILYDRIADRIRHMVEEGWLEEVARLLNDGLEPSLPAFQAIGYRQLSRHLRGEWSLDKALRETVLATRRFAKRQETWFRREPDVAWFQAEEIDQRVPEILEYLDRSGLGRVHD